MMDKKNAQSFESTQVASDACDYFRCVFARMARMHIIVAICELSFQMTFRTINFQAALFSYSDAARAHNFETIFFSNRRSPTS